MEIIWELLSQVADGILFHFVWKRPVATFATWGITTKGTPKNLIARLLVFLLLITHLHTPQNVMVTIESFITFMINKTTGLLGVNIN